MSVICFKTRLPLDPPTPKPARELKHVYLVGYGYDDFSYCGFRLAAVCETKAGAQDMALMLDSLHNGFVYEPGENPDIDDIDDVLILERALDI
jgi:hypothetical protein